MEECERYKEILETNQKPVIQTYSIPVHWACTLVHIARKENLIDNDLALVNMLQVKVLQQIYKLHVHYF